jgi:hypothetical protein
MEDRTMPRSRFVFGPISLISIGVVALLAWAFSPLQRVAAAIERALEVAFPLTLPMAVREATPATEAVLGDVEARAFVARRTARQPRRRVSMWDGPFAVCSPF